MRLAGADGGEAVIVGAGLRDGVRRGWLFGLLLLFGAGLRGGVSRGQFFGLLLFGAGRFIVGRGRGDGGDDCEEDDDCGGR